MAYSHHCRKCTDTKVCGKYHVYVIELDRKSALAINKFLKKNPHIDASFEGKCYYVGQTSHAPECRYKGHAGKRKNYICDCFGKTEKRSKENGNKPSKVTGPGNCIALRPSLYKHLNPVKGVGREGQKNAKKAEGDLARQLIEEGHAAYSDELK